MLVGFLHVGPDDRLARLMVKSALRFGYDLLQMTDGDSPIVEGVGRVVRLPWDRKFLMTYRMAHLAQIREPLCVVDTDVLFVRDVSDVWSKRFDVALTKRTNVILDRNGVDIAKVYPYNTGVMFCRNPEFWKRAHRICAALPEQLQTWYGDQESVKQAAPHFDTLELDVGEWNYSPESQEDKPPQARILHFKGQRKKWMQ